MSIRPYLEGILKDLVAIPSPPGEEEAALDRAGAALKELGLEPVRVPYDPGLVNDPEYVARFAGPTVAGRTNLVCRWGEGKKPAIVVQAHIDTVPAGEGQEHLYQPRVEGDTLYGRGACDDKGQVATLFAALKLLRDSGREPGCALELQIVGGEEVGGTGALDLVRKGVKADLVVVLEPVRLNVHPANRGALWFTLTIDGRETHMGRSWEGVCAIDQLALAVKLLRDYEQRHLAESRGYRLFENYEHPVQVNLGTVGGGTWPAMVCGQVKLEGGVGFLPNKSLAVIQEELTALFAGAPDEWLRKHHRLEYNGNRNEAYECDPDHPLIRSFHARATARWPDSGLFGWNVSCDARLYAHLSGIPTLVFGPGDIAHAHSDGEKIDLAEATRGAEILADFLADPTSVPAC